MSFDIKPRYVGKPLTNKPCLIFLSVLEIPSRAFKRVLMGTFPGIWVFLIGILTLFFSKTLSAQGGWGGVTYKIETLSGEALNLLGGGGAWQIDRHFYLGGAGYSLTHTVLVRDRTLESMGFGGLMMGYKYPLADRWRIAVQGLFSWGGYKWDGNSYQMRNFEPSANIWYKLNEFLNIQAGIYWRNSFVNVESPLSGSDLRAWGFQLSLFFGDF